MSGYITTLIGTVIICSLVAMLTPEDKGMLGYVKLAACLCVLCVAISPVTSFIRAVMDFEVGESFLGSGSDGKNNFDEIYEENLLGAGQKSASEGLRSMLCREFGLDSEEIEVSVKLSEAENEYKYVAESVTVIFVSGKAMFTDPHDVIDYVSELLGCRCEIIYA